jgi:hypothetical protein
MGTTAEQNRIEELHRRMQDIALEPRLIELAGTVLEVGGWTDPETKQQKSKTITFQIGFDRLRIKLPSVDTVADVGDKFLAECTITSSERFGMQLHAVTFERISREAGARPVNGVKGVS